MSVIRIPSENGSDESSIRVLVTYMWPRERYLTWQHQYGCSVLDELQLVYQTECLKRFKFFLSMLKGASIVIRNHVYTLDKVELFTIPPATAKYSGDLNIELVWYSNGPKQFVHLMVCYSSHVLNSKLIVCFWMVKSLVTEWHLVPKLFTMVDNQMVQTRGSQWLLEIRTK